MTTINDLTIGEIVTAISVITVFITAIASINNWLKKKTAPIDEFKKEMETVKRNQDNDNKRLKDLEKCSKLTLKATRALLEERIVNDDEDGRLAKIKDDIDEYLYE